MSSKPKITMTVCTRCWGSGDEPGQYDEEGDQPLCDLCHGTGEIRDTERS